MFKVQNHMNNNIFKVNASKKIDRNNEGVLECLNKLYARAERAVPEYGEFGIVKFDLKNKDKALDVNNVTLSIKPSILLKERPKERELEIVVKSADNLSTYSLVLGRGEKDEIMQLIKNEELPHRIEDFIRTASEKFSE